MVSLHCFAVHNKLITISISEFFTNLLGDAKQDLHFMFKKTYGILYERNSDVFTDFFKDLELYYENGNLDLEEALRKFFSHLYQGMLTVLNAQYQFDSGVLLQQEYLHRHY